VSSLVDTVIAEAPVPLVAEVTLPVARIGKCFADITEDAIFQPLLWVVFAHEHMRWRRRLSERGQRYPVPMSCEEVWMLIVHGITAVRTIALVPRPSSPSKAKPVLAAFACTVAPVA
jgi:hypothetical protein